MARGTRILFATDVHGSEACFIKFVKLAKEIRPHVAVLAGELTGKAVVPIVRRGHLHEVMGTRGPECLVTEADVVAFERRMRMRGLYPVRMDMDAYDAVRHDGVARRRLLAQCVMGAMRRWLSLADHGLRDTGVQLFISPAHNDDWIVDEVLRGPGPARNVDGGSAYIDDHHELLVIGHAHPTPHAGPRELPEDRLAEHIRRAADRLSDPHRAVFVLHAPPKSSGIDLVPTRRREGTDSPARPVAAGSRAVREALRDYQPLLGLHGHIHESMGAHRLGRTLCVNPGSQYARGALNAALLHIAKDKVCGFQLMTA